MTSTKQSTPFSTVTNSSAVSFADRAAATAEIEKLPIGRRQVWGRNTNLSIGVSREPDRYRIDFVDARPRPEGYGDDPDSHLGPHQALAHYATTADEAASLIETALTAGLRGATPPWHRRIDRRTDGAAGVRLVNEAPQKSARGEDVYTIAAGTMAVGDIIEFVSELRLSADSSYQVPPDWTVVHTRPSDRGDATIRHWQSPPRRWRVTRLGRQFDGPNREPKQYAYLERAP